MLFGLQFIYSFTLDDVADIVSKCHGICLLSQPQMSEAKINEIISQFSCLSEISPSNWKEVFEDLKFKYFHVLNLDGLIDDLNQFCTFFKYIDTAILTRYSLCFQKILDELKAFQQFESKIIDSIYGHLSKNSDLMSFLNDYLPLEDALIQFHGLITDKLHLVENLKRQFNEVFTSIKLPKGNLNVYFKPIGKDKEILKKLNKEINKLKLLKVQYKDLKRRFSPELSFSEVEPLLDEFIDKKLTEATLYVKYKSNIYLQKLDLDMELAYLELIDLKNSLSNERMEIEQKIYSWKNKFTEDFLNRMG